MLSNNKILLEEVERTLNALKCEGALKVSNKTYKTRYMKEYNNIAQYLEDRNIPFRVELKEGWGAIIRFEVKGKDIFANTFKNGKPQMYYYSKDYSCKPCRIRL